jgi:hypothetical protein
LLRERVQSHMRPQVSHCTERTGHRRQGSRRGDRSAHAILLVER